MRAAQERLKQVRDVRGRMSFAISDVTGRLAEQRRGLVALEARLRQLEEQGVAINREITELTGQPNDAATRSESAWQRQPTRELCRHRGSDHWQRRCDKRTDHATQSPLIPSTSTFPWHRRRG